MWLSAVSNRFLYSSGQPCSLFPLCAIGPLSNVTPALYGIEEPGEGWPHSRPALKCVFGVKKERRLLSNRAPHRSTQQRHILIFSFCCKHFWVVFALPGHFAQTKSRADTFFSLRAPSSAISHAVFFFSFLSRWSLPSGRRCLLLLLHPSSCAQLLPPPSLSIFLYRVLLCRMEADSCVPCGHHASLTTLGSGSADRITINPLCILTCTFLYVHVVKLNPMVIRSPHKTMLFNVWNKKRSCLVDAVPFLATFSRLDGCVYSKLRH